jgi:hypothetical protein
VAATAKYFNAVSKLIAPGVENKKLVVRRKDAMAPGFR